MNKNLYTILLFCLIHQFSISQDISLEGTIWLDSDENSQYDGEDGISDVKVYLINVDSTEILDSTFTINAEFNFPSSSSISIPPGSYYLEIAAEEFTIGGDLQNITSCPGSNDANDGVDLDDNGLDMIPIQTSNFSLDTGFVEHIDICLAAPCDEENALASFSCDAIGDINIICDIATLGTFCNSLPFAASPGNQPNPLCPEGGLPDNISWFAFVAYGGNYSIIVSPSACMGSTTGVNGIQVGIYTDCTFQESVFCDPDCSEDPIAIDSDLLLPGQVYYFFIDGCGDSVCSYSIDIEGSPIPPSLEADELCILDGGTIICEDSDYLTNQEIVFQLNDGNYNADYTWSIITLSGGPYVGDIAPMTQEDNIELTFTNEGIYEVCLTSISNGCQTFIASGDLCRTITVIDPLNVNELNEVNIKILPNPTSNYITLDGNLPVFESTFQIYSINGESVLSGSLDSSQKIDVKDIPAGLYIITIVDNLGVTKNVGRFVKIE